MAIEDANILVDIPMAVYSKEIFDIKYNLEGTVTEAKIVFLARGMMKWAKNEEDISSIFEYGMVMPDKAGEACGMWYQALIIPKALGVKDPNECFLFKKVPDTMVHICATQKWRKIYAIRMVLKKFEHGCIEFFKKNKLPDSPMPAPPKPGSAAAAGAEATAAI